MSSELGTDKEMAPSSKWISSDKADVGESYSKLTGQPLTKPFVRCGAMTFGYGWPGLLNGNYV